MLDGRERTLRPGDEVHRESKRYTVISQAIAITRSTAITQTDDACQGRNLILSRSRHRISDVVPISFHRTLDVERAGRCNLAGVHPKISGLKSCIEPLGGFPAARGPLGRGDYCSSVATREAANLNLPSAPNH